METLKEWIEYYVKRELEHRELLFYAIQADPTNSIITSLIESEIRLLIDSEQYNLLDFILEELTKRNAVELITPLCDSLIWLCRELQKPSSKIINNDSRIIN